MPGSDEIPEWLLDDGPPGPPPPGLRALRHLRAAARDERPPPAWEAALARQEDGRPTRDAGNAALIVLRHPAWRGVVSHDVVRDRVLVGTPPPLPRLPGAAEPPLPPPPPGDVCEAHDVYLQLWLRREYHQSWGLEACRSALIYAAQQQPRDPLRDYLRGVQWDGRLRLPTWLRDYGGAADTPTVSVIGRRWMISAVARALSPGCQADYVLVLEGEQGIGKTTLLSELVGSEWLLPDLPDLRDKDAMHVLRGAWCVLVDELAALTGVAGEERRKAFLTRREDVYRPPYGRDVVHAPRRCVFAATTNAHTYLTDPTGARRYWPVRLTRVDVDALRRDRDLLWAEAVVRYDEGERWHPESQEEIAALGAVQEERAVVDSWEELVAQYLGLQVTGSVTTHEILQYLLPQDGRDTPADQQRVARIMRRLGYEQARESGGSRRRVWRPRQ